MEWGLRVCPGVGPEGWLRCFAHPLGGVVSGGMCSTPLLLQAFQKWQLGFLVSLYLLSRICPNCPYMQLILVPYSFFVFCCWRRGVSRCRHCSTAAKGPRSQPVSNLSTWLNLSQIQRTQLKRSKSEWPGWWEKIGKNWWYFITERRPLRRWHQSVLQYLNSCAIGKEVKYRRRESLTHKRTLRAPWLGLGFSWSYSRIREAINHLSVLLERIMN